MLFVNHWSSGILPLMKSLAMLIKALHSKCLNNYEFHFASLYNHTVYQTMNGIKVNELLASKGAWQMSGDVTHVSF